MASTSASALKKTLRSEDKDIFLVGKCIDNILGVKLPSIKQVLQLFFYKMRVDKLNSAASAKHTIDVVLLFWRKANIPTLTEINCNKKLLKMHDSWKNLVKHKASSYDKHRQSEKEFSEMIENYIFDIAAPDALETMKIEEDKKFLLLQRQKGRPGSMSGFDLALAQKQKRKNDRLQQEEKRIKQNRNKEISSGNY